MTPKTQKIVGVTATVFPTLPVIFGGIMKLGFILLSCYFSGAMATELSHGMTPVVPAVLLVIIWISALVRDRFIFIVSPVTDPG